MDPKRHGYALQQRRVRNWVENSDPYAFFNLPSSRQLFGEVESLLREHRERLFPPTDR